MPENLLKRRPRLPSNKTECSRRFCSASLLRPPKQERPKVVDSAFHAPLKRNVMHEMCLHRLPHPNLNEMPEECSWRLSRLPSNKNEMLEMFLQRLPRPLRIKRNAQNVVTTHSSPPNKIEYSRCVYSAFLAPRTKWNARFLFTVPSSPPNKMEFPKCFHSDILAPRKKWKAR
jgi:hypothetical protein